MPHNREFRSASEPTGIAAWPYGMSDQAHHQLHRELHQRRLAKRIGVRELSGLLGYNTFSMVSDVENGARRVPPGKLIAWAEAVGMDPKVACRWWIEENCPDIARLLLG